ncbi:ribosomal protein L21 [Cavenderia fasciculata]|uniref:Large ribosomal subunit protein bL21m n=1 Tax=Cavenderia fasciculata TaxID=261658 RepID=F4Q736_CACFS|nr:ribosomal protein L21 [Cavenderia fasciculata]EGG16218.1 ribosomal protein L21 [Cavenderia fasciculata]|eukprot:XP_004354602.1 ribosomal protein L21 [Cavenderia fasciculata]
MMMLRSTVSSLLKTRMTSSSLYTPAAIRSYSTSQTDAAAETTSTTSTYSNHKLESDYVHSKDFNTVPESFAVVHVGGKQYKVIKGDVIMSDRLPVQVGDHIVLDKILLVGTKGSTMIGTPLVDGAKVHAFVEEQTKASKVTIFKHKRRKNYKRTTSFTPLATVLRIGDIILKKN